MDAWDNGQYAAAPRMADMAKRLESPCLDQQSCVRFMRMGADMALHELQMDLLCQQSITITTLFERIDALRASLVALTPPEDR